ncbi:MAG TPA: HEAT repeat domain-containing protein [Phycisphaeraceae bacterium]|nr:HEAT repeat domain-containing protein [Phycisphaeraceae bacterium]
MSGSGAAFAQDGSIFIDIPTSGSLPVVVPAPGGPAFKNFREEQARRADLYSFRQEVRRLRAKYFRNTRNAEIRREGIAKLSEYNQPDHFQVLIEMLEDEGEDVQYGLTEHFRRLADPSGDAALAWMALRGKQQETRELAKQALLDRVDALKGKVPDSVRYLVEQHIRSNIHAEAAAGAQLAQQLHLYEMIPTLIVSQVAQQRRTDNSGDLAFIAVATQRAFVSDLQPVVGDNAVGFDPQISVVSEGVVLRIRDAVIQVYRYDVHNSLLGLAEEDWGESLAYLGFDPVAWRNWYENEYRPYKLAQLQHNPESDSLSAESTQIIPAGR